MQIFGTDKVIVVTGASSGIGLALALQALEGGSKVAVCGRDNAKLEAAFSSVNNKEKLLLHVADVASEADCSRFVTAVLAKWGRMDTLVCNAGMSMRALFETVDLKVLKQLMDVNFWGTVHMAKHALPALKKNKGTIIGISSIAGYRGLPGRTGYSSSKFAMQGFLESLRTELLHAGVHVMWAAPGFTASNIRNTALNAGGQAQKETPLAEDKLMSAETCAALIWRAAEKRKRTVVMTLQGKATVWLNKLLPGFMDGMVFGHFAKEPGSPLKK
ncbi:MAG: SDR family oxidoreductase [Edaphocola sp.]